MLIQKAIIVRKNVQSYFKKPVEFYYLGCVFGAVLLIFRLLFPFLFDDQNEELNSSWKSELKKQDSDINLATKYSLNEKEDIVSHLKMMNFLKKLDLSYNDIDDKELIFITLHLREHLLVVEKLYLKRLHFGVLGLQYLSDLAIKSSKLESLNFKSNQNLKGSGKEIKSILMNSKSLKKINLQNCGLANEDIQAISEGLKSNQVLQSINLAENVILDEGALCISEALKYNRSVKKLLLFNNEITDVGILHISNALKENNTMKTLDIHFNYLGDNGGRYIGNLLYVNKSLEKINLLGCKINFDGIKPIVKVLKRNHTLRSLNLFYNSLKIQDIENLLKIFVYNQFLVELKIHDKEYGDKIDLKRFIEQKISRNKSIEEIRCKFSSLFIQKKSFDVNFSFV